MPLAISPHNHARSLLWLGYSAWLWACHPDKGAAPPADGDIDGDGYTEVDGDFDADGDG